MSCVSSFAPFCCGVAEDVSCVFGVVDFSLGRVASVVEGALAAVEVSSAMLGQIYSSMLDEKQKQKHNLFSGMMEFFRNKLNLVST